MDIEKHSNDINEIDYTIPYKERKDIIDSINFKTDEERIICSSIIKSLENQIAEGLDAHKVIAIPYIGCVRINDVRREFIRECRAPLATVKLDMTVKQFKELSSAMYANIKFKHELADDRRKYEYSFKRTNKKKYDELCKQFGIAYANLYLKALSWLREVPFNEEFEEQYKELRNKEKEEKKKESSDSMKINDNTISKNNIDYVINSQPRWDFKRNNKTIKNK